MSVFSLFVSVLVLSFLISFELFQFIILSGRRRRRRRGAGGAGGDGTEVKTKDHSQRFGKKMRDARTSRFQAVARRDLCSEAQS